MSLRHVLDLADDLVVLTYQAAARCLDDDPLFVVRCASCGGPLAKVWQTDPGPFFASEWRAPTGARQFVAREHLHLYHDPRHGVWALLAVPAGIAPDFPDLAVRCARDGTAILDRDALLSHYAAELRSVRSPRDPRTARPQRRRGRPFRAAMTLPAADFTVAPVAEPRFSSLLAKAFNIPHKLYPSV